MFEARLTEGAILKKVLDSVKDLVTDANFEADPTEGFKLQAMDSSHVSLVSLKLHADGFAHYRCDRPLTMGMNLANMVRSVTRSRVVRRREANEREGNVERSRDSSDAASRGFVASSYAIRCRNDAFDGVKRENVFLSITPPRSGCARALARARGTARSTATDNGEFQT